MIAPVENPPIDHVIDPPLAERFGRSWWIGVGLSLLGILLLLYGLRGPAFVGIGVWGTNIPYVWGFDIASYAWWIGIANGGALFASILVLTGSSLHTAVNRFANGLALGAAICAAIFPVFHLGRPWLAHWMIPYPTVQGVWPQFRSPLTWDFWAILTHLTAIALLWYVGLIPDLATLRDRAKTRARQIFYGLAALGWRGSARQWALHQRAHRIVALTLIPLLFLAQAIVSFEFVGTLVPDWHETRQPLHFIATGIQLGIAMVLLMALALRRRLRLDRHIDDWDIDLLAKLLLANALVTAYAYLGGWFMELMAEPRVREALLARITGPYGPLYWGGFVLSVLPPQIFWWRRARLHWWAGTLVSVLVLIGIYLDYLSVVVGGLVRTNLMIAAPTYAPTPAEASLLVGTIALFALMVLLSVRRLPIVSLYDTRAAPA